MSIRVTWSVFGSEAPFALIAGGLETELSYLGECEDSALAAVNAISARYFGDAVWERMFGLDLIEAEILVAIAAPANMAGAYEVTLRRVTTAASQLIRDPRLAHLPQSSSTERGKLVMVERV